MFETRTAQYGSPAIYAASNERMDFIRKVYITFFAGLLICAGGTYLGITNETVRTLSLKIFQIHWALYLAIVLGMVFAVQALSTIPRVNYIAFAAFTFFFGLILTPLIIFSINKTGSTEVVKEAALLTFIVFGLLSLYATMTKRDFTVYRSALIVALIVIFAITVIGIIMGFAGATWMSIVWILLMAAYIVYETQMILRKYPTNMHVSAAIALFINFIIMFQRILMLLNRRR